MASSPVDHTGIIESTRDALDKLWWNFGVFERELSTPGIGEGQAFAIIDFAGASGSVHAWFCEEYAERYPPGLDGPLGPATTVSDTLASRVRWWKELRAISNAAKHRKISGYWPGFNRPLLRMDKALAEEIDADATSGLVRIMNDLADGRAWYENAFYATADAEPTLARDALMQNYTDWHAVLDESGMKGFHDHAATPSTEGPNFPT